MWARSAAGIRAPGRASARSSTLSASVDRGTLLLASVGAPVPASALRTSIFWIVTAWPVKFVMCSSYGNTTWPPPCVTVGAFGTRTSSAGGKPASCALRVRAVTATSSTTNNRMVFIGSEFEVCTTGVLRPDETEDTVRHEVGASHETGAEVRLHLLGVAFDLLGHRARRVH